MKLLHSVVPFSFLLVGCVAGIELSEKTETSGAALGTVTWENTKAHGTGAPGCHFLGDRPNDEGNFDAYVLANGGDVAVVFTRLGEPIRVHRKELSECTVTIPVTVPEGYALTAWTQTLSYGVVKPAGAKASLGVSSFFKGTKGGTLNLPDIEKTFNANADVNIAFDVLSTGTETFNESHGRFANWRKRWCERKRERGEVNLALEATATAKVKLKNDTQEVILAVDGLDMRLDAVSKFEACPPG